MKRNLREMSTPMKASAQRSGVTTTTITPTVSLTNANTNTKPHPPKTNKSLQIPRFSRAASRNYGFLFWYRTYLKPEMDATAASDLTIVAHIRFYTDKELWEPLQLAQGPEQLQNPNWWIEKLARIYNTPTNQEKLREELDAVRMMADQAVGVYFLTLTTCWIKCYPERDPEEDPEFLRLFLQGILPGIRKKLI